MCSSRACTCTLFLVLYLANQLIINIFYIIQLTKTSYFLFLCRFDDLNSEKLRIISKETCQETDIFDFDPMNIDWEDYMINVHIPGLVKYVM